MSNRYVQLAKKDVDTVVKLISFCKAAAGGKQPCDVCQGAIDRLKRRIEALPGKPEKKPKTKAPAEGNR